MVGILSRVIVATTLKMPKWFVGWVSKRYVAGPNLEGAVNVMKRLQAEGACFTIDVLGEEISSMQEAEYFLSEYVDVIKAITDNNLDANLSIKPTAFGLLNRASALSVILFEFALINLIFSTFINVGFCFIVQLTETNRMRSKVCFFIIFYLIYMYLRATKIRFINWYPLHAY